MEPHPSNTVTVHPTVRRNPGALLRMLVSLALASALAVLVVTSGELGDSRPTVGVVAALFGAYGLLTITRWRYRNRIEVDDDFVMVFSTAERHGVWFRRREIRCLVAGEDGVRVDGAYGPLGTFGSTDWHGRPVRALTDAIGCRSRGVWPPAVLTVPASVLTSASQGVELMSLPRLELPERRQSSPHGHRTVPADGLEAATPRSHMSLELAASRAAASALSGCACRRLGAGGWRRSP
jgi:hypothetical protein